MRSFWGVKMPDRIEYNIICPFFKYAKRYKIVCDPLNEDAVSFTMNFDSVEKRTEYIHAFCSCGCWQGCAVAQLIWDRFNRGNT